MCAFVCVRACVCVCVCVCAMCYQIKCFHTHCFIITLTIVYKINCFRCIIDYMEHLHVCMSVYVSVDA